MGKEAASGDGGVPRAAVRGPHALARAETAVSFTPQLPLDQHSPAPAAPVAQVCGRRGWHGVRESEGESVQPRAPPSLTRLCAPPPACLDKIWYPRHPTAAGDAAFERRPPPLLPRGPEGGRDPPLPR